VPHRGDGRHQRHDPIGRINREQSLARAGYAGWSRNDPYVILRGDSGRPSLTHSHLRRSPAIAEISTIEPESFWPRSILIDDHRRFSLAYGARCRGGICPCILHITCSLVSASSRVQAPSRWLCARIWDLVCTKTARCQWWGMNVMSCALPPLFASLRPDPTQDSLTFGPWCSSLFEVSRQFDILGATGPSCFARLLKLGRPHGFGVPTPTGRAPSCQARTWTSPAPTVPSGPVRARRPTQAHRAATRDAMMANRGRTHCVAS
jgi:hypothetical protein